MDGLSPRAALSLVVIHVSTAAAAKRCGTTKERLLAWLTGRESPPFPARKAMLNEWGIPLRERWTPRPPDRPARARRPRIVPPPPEFWVGLRGDGWLP